MMRKAFFVLTKVVHSSDEMDPEHVLSCTTVVALLCIIASRIHLPFFAAVSNFSMLLVGNSINGSGGGDCGNGCGVGGCGCGVRRSHKRRDMSVNGGANANGGFDIGGLHACRFEHGARGGDCVEFQDPRKCVGI